MKLLITGIILSLCNLTNLPTPVDQKEKDLTALRYLKEVEWPKAYKEQDQQLLDRILAEEFQVIDAGGGWSNKMGELKWISENQVSYDSFYYDIQRLEILENQTALICGTGHIWQSDKESIYSSSNVLIKRGDNWKAVASHISGFKEVD